MNSKLKLYDKLLCMGCLCVGQTLEKITQHKHREFYVNTLKDIDVTFPDLIPSMCVECINMLKKAVAFQEQIQKSYNLLLTYPVENMESDLNDSVSHPLLETAVKDPFSDDEKKIKRETDIDEIYIAVANNGPSSPVPGDSDGDSMDVPISVIKSEKMKREHDENVEENSRTNYALSGYEECLIDDSDNMKEEENHRAMLDTVDNSLVRNISNKKVCNLLKIERERNTLEKPTSKRKINSRKEKKTPPFISVDLSAEEMREETERERGSESYLRAKFKCESCVMKFNNERRYSEHVKKRHSKSIGDYLCPVCSTYFNTVDSFTTHYKRHMTRYECTICKKRTADVKEMQQHCYAEHNISLKQYKCSKCAFTTCSINTLRYHKESHRSRLRVSCAHCDKIFSHRASLMNHSLAFHSGRNAFTCEECGAQFRWKASLMRHAAKHHHNQDDAKSSTRAHCIPCDISFSSASSYQRHLKNSLKHVSQNDLRYICDHCGRRFSDKTKLRNHIEEKHLFWTFRCHICNKPSKNRVGLDQHIRNVHRGRPNNMICHHCGKGFPTTMQLESHLRTHTGERPFICEYCPTTFSQKSNLYKHKRQVHRNKSKRATPKAKDKLEASIDTTMEQNTTQQQHTYSFIM